jgi:hypothetical protein
MAVLAVATEAITRYTGMLLDPLRPHVQIGDHEHPQILLSVLGGLILVGATTVLVRWRARMSSYEWLAIGLGGSALALVVHVFRLSVNTVVADRYLYLPLAAVAIGVAAQRLCALWPPSRPSMPTCPCCKLHWSLDSTMDDRSTAHQRSARRVPS